MARTKDIGAGVKRVSNKKPDHDPAFCL